RWADRPRGGIAGSAGNRRGQSGQRSARGRTRSPVDLHGPVVVDGLLDLVGMRDGKGLDLDALLARTADADVTDVEDAVEEGLADLNVAHVVVEHLRGALAEEPLAHDRALV